MKRSLLIPLVMFALLAFVALGLMVPVAMADGQASNLATGAEAAKVKANPAAEDVLRMALADALIRYGRDAQSPEALITAAQILGGIRTSPLGVTPERLADATPPAEQGQKDTQRPSSDPQSLLDEAKDISSEDPHIVALADRVAAAIAKMREGTAAARGAVGGPKYTLERVLPGSTDVYRVSFRAGETARVMVSGDGDTDLDLYVYDENGNLIESDEDYSDDCVVSWVPRWTGLFVIKIHNRGGVYNQYEIATN